MARDQSKAQDAMPIVNIALKVARRKVHIADKESITIRTHVKCRVQHDVQSDPMGAQ